MATKIDKAHLMIGEVQVENAGSRERPPTCREGRSTLYKEFLERGRTRSAISEVLASGRFLSHVVRRYLAFGCGIDIGRHRMTLEPSVCCAAGGR